MILHQPAAAMARWLASLAGARRAAVLFAAGAMLSLALAPAYVWPVVFVAFPVVVWIVDGWCGADVSRLARFRRGLAAGWLFGFGFFAASLYWIGVAFLVDAEQFAWLMPLAVLAMPAGLALFWGLGVGLAAALSRPGLDRCLALAISLSLAEWLRGTVLTGFPWNAAGYLLTGIPGVEQAASLVGLYGLGALTLSWGVAPALLAVPGRRDRFAAAAALVLLIAVALWGELRLAGSDRNPGTRFDVILIQANIAQRLKWDPAFRDETIARYFELSGPAAPAAAGPRPDRTAIMVWPESALPVLVDESPVLLEAMAGLLRPGDMLLFGSLRREPAAAANASRRAFNSILAVDGDGNLAARYDKWRLVPFGEYLPFAPVLEALGLRKVVPVPLGFASGPGPVNLAAGDLPPFAPLICYEAVFPRTSIDRRSRPGWLLNVTNDGWFGRTAGPYQHFAQVRMRAIEEGLPLVRAANSGISAVVDPLGRTVARLGLGEAGVIRASLPAGLERTPFALVGNAGFVGLLLFLWVAKAVESTRARSESRKKAPI